MRVAAGGRCPADDGGDPTEGGTDVDLNGRRARSRGLGVLTAVATLAIYMVIAAVPAQSGRDVRRDR